jgi:hypothetical protein
VTQLLTNNPPKSIPLVGQAIVFRGLPLCCGAGHRFS